jgi:hypothetical protein
LAERTAGICNAKQDREFISSLLEHDAGGGRPQINNIEFSDLNAVDAWMQARTLRVDAGTHSKKGERSKRAGAFSS